LYSILPTTEETMQIQGQIKLLLDEYT